MVNLEFPSILGKIMNWYIDLKNFHFLLKWTRRVYVYTQKYMNDPEIPLHGMYPTEMQTKMHQGIYWNFKW